ncbi:glycosyltransferase family 32 protein [Crassisporium funariophilum]|nr:glycosyltransferase family 32 protein [Crassisporium funariophilum]
MASSSYFPKPQRQNGQHRGRLSFSSNALPLVYSPSASSSSAVQEKYAKRALQSPWWIPVSLRIPGFRRRRVFLLNPRRLHDFSVTRFGRKRGSILLCVSILFLIFFAFALAKRFGTHAKQWPTPFTGDPPTLVYKREDIQRIWQWEVASGHYPSRQRIPEQLRLKEAPENPALPPRRDQSPPPGLYSTTTRGTGAKRIYLDIQSAPENAAYPPRPVPGSVADLDVIMEHCDFSEKKFVRDCLEVLRVGAGLDNGRRVRRGKLDDWKYIYIEQLENTTHVARGLDSNEDPASGDYKVFSPDDASDPDGGLVKSRSAEWETPPIALPKRAHYRPSSTSPQHCDPENPRIFHMFWTGAFTDKPYLAILSFLFTQNTGLHVEEYPSSGACRPQFWLWINPGPAATVPNPSAVRDMFSQLRDNPWSSPFLHPRFKDIIQFKLWNTTEQLDGVPELKDEWRSRDLFNSGGHVMNVPSKLKESQTAQTAQGNSTSTKTATDDMVNRVGSKSSSTYDRLSVILSDMARFILCHRFGGIYLDADTLFLRDWEELWGWKGAFAYRWSRLEKYNTAVLHLNKNSALGTFLFRTALKNNLDFHPMIVSRYTKEAYVEGLLLRLPDALFDSAWLSTEDHQHMRPPQPFFTNFGEFFDTPSADSAAPQALGFDGFFRGAFSYHFHNFWWKPFDDARNWPDLGHRFAEGEKVARKALRQSEKSGKGGIRYSDSTDEEDNVEDDRRDLDWATVLKRVFEAYIRGERPNMYGEMLRW